MLNTTLMWYWAVKYDLLGSKVAFLLSTGKFFVFFEVTLSGSRVPGYIIVTIQVQFCWTRLLNKTNITRVHTYQWRIQDFPKGNANPGGGGANLLFGLISAKNCMKKIWLRGARAQLRHCTHKQLNKNKVGNLTGWGGGLLYIRISFALTPMHFYCQCIHRPHLVFCGGLGYTA